VSYARNTGIAEARAEIIAFADDDVRVSKDWVAKIKRAFALHPEIDFLGGKILPRWKNKLPGWLTRDHWWALALLDYGDEPFYVNADNPLCLPTANASFRRDVFKRFGLFSPEFSGREDHEFLLRLWQAGSCGIYAPTIVVIAEVQPERLKKNYHRRWNTATGKFNSQMRLNEIMGPDGRIVGESNNAVTLFGVPGFVYRGLFDKSRGWVWTTLLGRKAASQRNKNSVWYLIGYISKRYEQHTAQRKHSTITEIGAFIKALWRKKFNRNERRQAFTGRS
jgi:glycosyltransferase involved in cell wall biosynthesis